jgi:MFS family permease
MSEPSPSGPTIDRRAATVAMLLAMAVTALEMTVVSPAMPRIIASLRGFDIYPWVPSAYILASTVTVPLYGKLADRLGRKRVLIFGLMLFAMGSVLSGAAVSMPMLIAMRAVQGLGAGAVAPIVLTLIGDLYTLEERAKVQGLFSGVWGICSLAGPALGGVLTDRLSWRWVFYVTVPFALAAMGLLAARVEERVARRAEGPLDWPGSVLVALGSALLLLGALGAERWAGHVEMLLFGAGVVVLLVLVGWERRAPDPILPMDLLARPPIAAAVGGSFLIGALLMALDTYVPLYVQGVRGGTATAAGGAITPLFVTWSISVALAAKVVVRLGFRGTATLGAAFIAAGMGGLAFGAAWPDRAGSIFLAAMIATGIGMGPAALSYLLSVQHVVPWGRRGAATGAVVFFRLIGGALGVGALGATLGHGLARRLGTLSGIDPADALLPEKQAELSPALMAAVREALGGALGLVFVQMFVLAAIAVVLSAFLPPGRIETRPAEGGEGDDPYTAEIALEMG